MQYQLVNRLTEVARILTGEDVQVRIRDPIYIGAVGSAYRTSEGKAVIDVSPDQPDQLFFWTFLEELAHVALGHCQPGEFWKLPSKSVSVCVANRLDGHPRERQAKDKALKWLDYAHASVNSRELEDQLTVMLSYPGDQVWNVIQKAVRGEVARAVSRRGIR